MNCERYRQAVSADPAAFEGTGDHASSCPDCRDYRDDLRALDERILQALRIRTPELTLPQLPPVVASIENRPGQQSPKARGLPLPLWAGLAAAISAVAVLFMFSGEEVAPRPLAAHVIAHMDHEQASRRVSSVAVPAQRLGEVLAPQVAAMGEDIGLITYAVSCVINGRRVPHLVVQGHQGPLTVILLPRENLEEAVSFAEASLHGVILPVAGGSVAVIAEREEQRAEVERLGVQLAANLEWRT